MFVSMWMTREVISVAAGAPLGEIAASMSRHRIRRMPVVSQSGDGPRLLGIVTHSDVLHAFPANINPFAVSAAESIAALRQAGGKAVTAGDLMTRDPHTTTPDAPIETAARLMRDRKIGALPVVSQGKLVGLITESDIFRAMVEVFGSTDRAVRITFSLTPGEDVLPLIADIAKRRSMRVETFMSLPTHEPPVCVVQLAGNAIEETLNDVWQSKHRVMNVVHVAGTDNETPT